ncbi:MAG: nucleotidyltransferase domain-containing protein [archaeon]
MYEKLNITENHLQALTLFTRGFDREYYIREVQKLLKISPRTAQLILNDLEKKAVLESKLKGKIRTYRLKNTQSAIDYLIIAEQYKKISFLENKPMIKEIITKITPSITGIGLIFGSYAKGLQKKESDLDIFIAGDYDKNTIKKTSELYGIELSAKSYPREIFEKEIKRDILLKEIQNDHIIFQDAERFIKTAMVTTNG